VGCGWGPPAAGGWEGEGTRLPAVGRAGNGRAALAAAPLLVREEVVLARADAGREDFAGGGGGDFLHLGAALAGELGVVGAAVSTRPR
jgi:hypothetical protein